MAAADDLTAHAALAASGHAFAVSDARADDAPLTWVNPAFERLTGTTPPTSWAVTAGCCRARPPIRR